MENQYNIAHAPIFAYFLSGFLIRISIFLSSLLRKLTKNRRFHFMLGTVGDFMLGKNDLEKIDSILSSGVLYEFSDNG